VELGYHNRTRLITGARPRYMAAGSTTGLCRWIWNARKAIVGHPAVPKPSIIGVIGRFVCSDYGSHLECDYVRHIWRQFKLNLQEKHPWIYFRSPGQFRFQIVLGWSSDIIRSLYITVWEASHLC